MTQIKDFLKTHYEFMLGIILGLLLGVVLGMDNAQGVLMQLFHLLVGMGTSPDALSSLAFCAIGPSLRSVKKRRGIVSCIILSENAANIIVSKLCKEGIIPFGIAPDAIRSIKRQAFNLVALGRRIDDIIRYFVFIGKKEPKLLLMANSIDVAMHCTAKL